MNNSQILKTCNINEHRPLLCLIVGEGGLGRDWGGMWGGGWWGGGSVLITGVCWGNLYKCFIGQTLKKVMPNKVRWVMVFVKMRNLTPIPELGIPKVCQFRENKTR